MSLEAIKRPLSIQEIDFRVQSINKGGYATILAYKDARVDMNRLDEAFTVFGWQKKFELINGNLFCHVGIWNDANGEWVWKSDVGTESMTEKEKGQASDAFKRACFNIGIGRELYDYPIIQVKLNANEFKIDGSFVKPTFDFRLKDWRWYAEFNDKGVLTYLACKDDKGVKRWEFGKLKTT
jgi:hypothetical protein